jgi:predicted kinase
MKLIMENWNRYLKEQETPLNLFVLVGPPSVGKSSWINDTFIDKEPYIINRELLQKLANSGEAR